MSSVNKAILVGRLGKDPEVRTMQSGDRVANFSLATSESWKDKATGARQEKTQWHNVVVFNQNLIGVVERFARKGDRIYVEGQIETRKFAGSDGVDRYATEIVLRPYRGEVVLLGEKKDAADTFTADEFRRAKSEPPKSGFMIDDEIPF